MWRSEAVHEEALQGADWVLDVPHDNFKTWYLCGGKLFASFQCYATDDHWAHLKRILKYVRATADYNSVSRKSMEAETLSVSTRKQTAMVLSTTEFMDLCQASCEAIWVVSLLKMIHMKVTLPMTIHEDNQPCIVICEEPRKRRRMKHNDSQYFFFLRGLIQQKQIKLHHQPTEDHIANLMMKGLPAPILGKLWRC